MLAKALNLKNKLIHWRRDFHQHPELGFEEFRTSDIVARYLEALGLDVRRGVGQTGVVGLLQGQEDGPTIALRADMDALPIEDQKQVDYRSKISGIAHACGHDAHTSILMGVAQVLVEHVTKIKGNVKFIFQPAEEGLGGAEAMIRDNVLLDPRVDAIAGLHVHNSIPTGHISAVRGVSCAAADQIWIKIIGKGGHAAYPHQTIDAISVAGEVISALQHITSRQIDPLDSIVITIGKIRGGSASNVIAPEVEMKGTVRTINPKLREEMPQRIKTVIHGVTSGLGASYEFNYQKGYPSIINDNALIDLLLETVDDVMGKNCWELGQPTMGSEDFSYYTQHVPGVFFRLGTGNKQKGSVHSGHHPAFDIDEDSLPIGVALLSAFALNYLHLQSLHESQGGEMC